MTVRSPIAGDSTLSGSIDLLVREGALFERLPGNAVHCFACGHNCKIKPGGRGICQVRYNANGTLYVPWGYVSALHADPVEKKPFFHVHPGSDVLTFGMLGCDLHCSYCFTPDTRVVTDLGPITLGELFDSASKVEHRPDADVAYPSGSRAMTRSGSWRCIEAVFKHRYHGGLVVIRPYYLPALRCTPDHRVYATDDVTQAPRLIRARDLLKGHYLAIPRFHSFSAPQIVDVEQVLKAHCVTYRTPWTLTLDERQMILEATISGETSQQIGAKLGRSASYIRHVRCKLARGHGDTRTGGVLLEEGKLRFPNEHRPGIPSILPFDEKLARLFGYYCAEGSVARSNRRPNSLTLNFSFAPNELAYADEVRTLLRETFGLSAALVKRSTTLAVAVTKATAAQLFGSLCGTHADEKTVPKQLFDAPLPVIQAFLDAFINGDGHRYSNGKISITTVSASLAYGVACLALKVGRLPALYDAQMPMTGTIQGRTVRRPPHQYTVVWYEGHSLSHRFVETDNFYLIPLRAIKSEDYDGDVYNMQVEGEHNYLAGFFLVSNCQNWDISQALRDSAAGGSATRVSPEQLVQLAKRQSAHGIASSYNEPLITSEWAMDIFKQAKAAGLLCMFVSNGNATRQVLEYIRPFTDAYKIDLKTMRDANYRALGAVLAHILDGVRMVHAMGFWLEIVTLIVPGFNDSDEELTDAAQFIKSVSPDIPWHVTAFHQDYKMRDTANTGAGTLMRAAQIGYAEGLHYVYAGNRPGRSGEFENTYCPNCHTAVIERTGFQVRANRLVDAGECPQCHTRIPGIWQPNRV